MFVLQVPKTRRNAEIKHAHINYVPVPHGRVKIHEFHIPNHIMLMTTEQGYAVSRH